MTVPFCLGPQSSLCRSCLTPRRNSWHLTRSVWACGNCNQRTRGFRAGKTWLGHHGCIQARSMLPLRWRAGPVGQESLLRMLHVGICVHYQDKACGNCKLRYAELGWFCLSALHPQRAYGVCRKQRIEPGGRNYQGNITGRTLLRRTYEVGQAGLGASVVATSTGNGWHAFRDSDSGKVEARADLSKSGCHLARGPISEYLSCGITFIADKHSWPRCSGWGLKQYRQPLPRVMIPAKCMALTI